MTYLLLFSVVLFARGADLLSTLFVTPDLRHESNPVFRRVGWKWGVVLNILLCFAAATSLNATVIIAVASILTALTNFFGAPSVLGLSAVIIAISIGLWLPAVALGILLYGAIHFYSRKPEALK